jgi:hypothetical protein
VADSAHRHQHADTFRVTWPNPFSQGRPTFASFTINPDGKVTRLSAEIMRDAIDAERMASPAAH